MQKLTLYRIISFILLPIATLFGLVGLFGLLAGLANPAALLPAFGCACVAIYVATSFAFLMNGISGNRPRKPSLKDWIRVNAIVSMIVAIMMLLNVAVFISQPHLLSEALEQTPMPAGSNQFPKEVMIRMMKGMMYFFGVAGLLLLVHILMTFRLLRQYDYLFDDTNADGA